MAPPVYAALSKMTKDPKYVTFMQKSLRSVQILCMIETNIYIIVTVQRGSCVSLMVLNNFGHVVMDGC